MRETILGVLAILASVACATDTPAYGAWEPIGPDVGSHPESFCVTSHALYLGLAEVDSVGLGLLRHSFGTGEWTTLGFPGSHVTGVTVWGEADENLVAIRYDDATDISNVVRSTDGGGSWTTTWTANGRWEGLSQACSDRTRIVLHDWLFSSDGGWTWCFGPVIGLTDVFDIAINPANANFAYVIGESMDWGAIGRTTDGGAHWGDFCIGVCGGSALAVGRADPQDVMGAMQQSQVNLSTDGGVSWWYPAPAAPIPSKAICCPPWAPGAFFIAGCDPVALDYEVWQTADRAGSWTQCGTGLPLLSGPSLRAAGVYIVGHPTEPVLYAAFEGAGVWRWRLEGAGAPEDGSLPRDLELTCVPNPVSGASVISFRLPDGGNADLRMFDAGGRCVRTLGGGWLAEGTHRMECSREGDGGETLPGGVYWLRLASAGAVARRTIVVLP